MKINFKQWWTSIPRISTERRITSHLNWTHWTQKQPRQEQTLGGVKPVNGIPTLAFDNWISNDNILRDYYMTFSILGTIWKISCHNLFITYFTLTFSKRWLIYVVYMLQFCTSYNMYKKTVHVITWTIQKYRL